MSGNFGIYFLTVTCLVGFTTGQEVNQRATRQDVEYAADALAKQFTFFYFTSIEPPNKFEVKRINGVKVTPFHKGRSMPFKIYTISVLLATKFAYTTSEITHPPMFLTCKSARIKETADGYYSILSASCIEKYS